MYKNVAGESDNVEYNCTKAGANGKTSGGFSFAGSYGWNDGSANTFDNVLCYKLYEIESTTEDIRYGELTVENSTVTVSGLSYYNTTATPILAVYGENNRLLGVSYVDGQPETLAVTNVNASDIVKVKLMLWADAQTMKSVRNALIVK